MGLSEKINVVNEDVYRNLMNRMENKNEWAVKMLRSEAGLEKLAGLITDAKTKEKGLKIISEYPKVKEELTERLNRMGIKI